MSEGLFRFEGLCLGGLEWFLRDNAGLEAGGTRRRIEFGQLLSRWGSEGRTKGKLFPAHPQEGGGAAEPATGRRASCVAWLGGRWAPILCETKPPRGLWGSARFAARPVNLSCSSHFRGFVPWPHLGAGEVPGLIGCRAESGPLANAVPHPPFKCVEGNFRDSEVKCFSWLGQRPRPASSKGRHGTAWSASRVFGR